MHENFTVSAVDLKNMCQKSCLFDQSFAKKANFVFKIIVRAIFSLFF